MNLSCSASTCTSLDFNSPFAEPLVLPELLLTQQASGAGHLWACSLFHLSWWSAWSQHSQTHHMDSQGQALLWEHLSLFQQDCHCGELCGMGLCGGCEEMLSPSSVPGAAGCVLSLAVCSMHCCLSPSGIKSDCKLSPVPVWIDSQSTGQ